MKNNLSIIELNLENLTKLWETVGIPYNGYQTYSTHQQSFTQNSQWPNRIWVDNSFNSNNILHLKENIFRINKEVTIPIWNNSLFKDFENNGFKMKFQQTGMSLNLKGKTEVIESIELKKVSNNKDAKIWSQIFKESFGYIINPETLEKSLNKVNYYLAVFNGNNVGTALTYKSNTVLGVHSIGIPKNHRRKGYANKIMNSIINMGIKDESNFLVLQASDMGKTLYQKLGFQEDFLIKNYSLE